MNTRVEYVSYSRSAPLETRQLGEDWHLIEEVQALLAQLDGKLDAARVVASSPETREAAHKLYMAFHDARHDASWPQLYAGASLAVIEANVKPTLVSA